MVKATIVPGEEGAEIQSPKRKIIRVESEETQDYVREAKDTGQEEAEGLSFVPSAISAPRKPMILFCQSVQREDPQLLAVGVGGDTGR